MQRKERRTISIFEVRTGSEKRALLRRAADEKEINDLLKRLISTMMRGIQHEKYLGHNLFCGA
jgi:hypothetical protein